MNNIINSILTIEEHARIKVEDAKKAAKEMVANAELESVKRIDTIKRKASEQINAIDSAQKAQADAVIENESIIHNQRISEMKSIFDENKQQICDELFKAVIEAE